MDGVLCRNRHPGQCLPCAVGRRPLTEALTLSPLFAVAVRTLCDFAARTGDLDLRYTPSPTSEEGMEGYRRVAASRGPHYQAEYSIQGECQGLLLKGRADGYDPVAGALEEVKTHRGDLSRLSPGQRGLH